MDYKGISEVDLKLHLLSGEILSVEGIDIQPYTLREIMKYGYDKYLGDIQWLLLSTDDFIKLMADEGKKVIVDEYADKLKAFDFYIQFGGEELQEILIHSLSMILRTDDLHIVDDKYVVVDYSKSSSNDDEFKLVTRDNFGDIVDIIRYQNYIERDFKKKNLKAANKETEELLKHMEALRKKAKKKKQNDFFEDDEDITIAEIISAVSAKSNSINKFNVWDLTLYQLYDEFGRLELIDNYEVSIKAMMAGAKTELTHWSSKLK